MITRPELIRLVAIYKGLTGSNLAGGRGTLHHLSRMKAIPQGNRIAYNVIQYDISEVGEVLEYILDKVGEQLDEDLMMIAYDTVVGEREEYKK